MSNSKTSEVSRAYDQIKRAFIEISAVANAATYERLTVTEAVARINDALVGIDAIIDRSLSHVEVAEHEVTTVVTSLNSHWWTGDTW